MLLVFIFGILFNSFLFQIIQAGPTSCITCINCQDSYDGSDVNATCSSTMPNADSCQKFRIQVPGATLVAKGCARSCEAKSIIAGPVRLDVTCCTGNNCNGATKIIFPPILFVILSIIIILFI